MTKTPTPASHAVNTAPISADLRGIDGAQPAAVAQQDPLLLAVHLRELASLAASGSAMATLCVNAANVLAAQQERIEELRAGSSIHLDLKQATAVLEMFGGEPGEVALLHGQNGHSGPGLYAAWTADAEGSVYLGETDEEAEPDAPASPAQQDAGTREELGYLSAEHYAADMQAVGESLMEAIKDNYAALQTAGWHRPLDGPAEIVADLLNLIDEAKAAQAQQDAPAAAWMTPDGDRVVTETTMAGARKDGGAMLSSLRPYKVALVRADARQDASAAHPSRECLQQSAATEYPPLPEPVADWVQRGSVSVGGGAYGHEIAREGLFTAEQMRDFADDTAALRANRTPAQEHATQLAGQGPLQQRVQPWLLECFGAEIAGDKQERNHRFLEEAVELVQANGCTASEAHQLVDYVFGRPVGEPAQEVGGVMVTLAALCLASGLDMHAAGETELARIWTKVDAIRAKQAAKPKHSPLPAAPASQDAQDAARLDAMEQYRMSVVPEYEGPWAASIYGEDDEPAIVGSGATPRAAIDAALATQQAGEK